MSGLLAFLDHALWPPIFYALGLGALIIALRSRWAWTRLGGAIAALPLVTFLVVAFLDPGFRELVFAPHRLPALIFTLVAIVVLWIEVRRLHRRTGGLGEGSGRVVAIVLGLLFLAVVFAFEPPLAGPPGFDPGDGEGRVPWYLALFQELARFFPPWVAWGLAPIAIVGAIVALPALVAAEGDFEDRRVGTTFTLVAALLAILLPILVAVFLRGSDGSYQGPFGGEGPWSLEPVVLTSLSEAVWIGLLGMAPPRAWFWRELPGLAALAFYFVALPWLLARVPPTRHFFGGLKSRLGVGRYHLGLMLALAFLLVPLAMYSRWFLGLGALVEWP